MHSLLAGIAGAVWLGVLVAVSPCPLATNILAITYIGRESGIQDRRILARGICYVLGRALAYLLLGYILAAGLLSVPSLAMFLQHDFNKVLGPILIIVGLMILGIFKLDLSFMRVGEKFAEKVSGNGVMGSFVLGILFALSFCPVSAALFFGSLVPLAMKSHASFLAPLAFSIGTSLPVVLFAILLAFGTTYIGTVYNRITQIEKWFRRVTGILFVAVGLYFIAVHILNIL
jgi:cytochrome c biogenesis protein CcdA